MMMMQILNLFESNALVIFQTVLTPPWACAVKLSKTKRVKHAKLVAYHVQDVTINCSLCWLLVIFTDNYVQHFAIGF